ncbi:unnamed protein product [Arabidopsis thaliana]|uniref:ADP-ribosyl cyclase/cyclic ADP-ribose hydrolase n=1 Tax=Arabidopsis thaliana TaxID=3702 RepID=A0A654EJ06_ARATH|nr:unnamed protein product [Arabidopsis thaliana]
MASSSSSPRNWRYNVFTSFHGPDVRIKFLSHLRQQFIYNGITMFDDNGIERSQIIAPALQKAIGESRIAILLLSKNYASSRWCLDELLEILKCKEDIGQIVMTVFYEVDPSHVRKQTGDFGNTFNKTCATKTEEERSKWSEALTYVGNIAGEHFLKWDNEAEMIEKIARDVSNKLNATPCRDFDGMVGLEAHLRKMESLLDLDNVGVKMVGISGPAGIGKSTIARALHSRLSNKFQHTCFMDNLRGSYNTSLEKYGLQLYLQEQFLSKVLKLKGIRICHLGVIKDRLQYLKVLVILDDVESLDQLEALANITWFGPGSRVIVITENKEIWQQHGIKDIYHVGFPSRREALMIFCLSAFRQTCPPDGFKDLVDDVASICGDLPLGLHVLGSSLRGKSQADWKDELPRLRNSLDGRIESVLKVGYESLHEKDQALFLHIAVFFNYENVDHVTAMLAKSNLDVRLGLKILANKYLIHIDHDRESTVVMHRLLQVMAEQVISKQEPWKRQILVDPKEISYVLENEVGNGSIVGVSFDVAHINKLIISSRAFERMYNLVFLKVYDGRHCSARKTYNLEGIEFPRHLRLLHWDAYPRKSLPRRFYQENIVELNMVGSHLEKLWDGTQQLANLKKMDLRFSSRLKELPDLSNATNLESLNLICCYALLELPSSIENLHKIDHLAVTNCTRLRSIPDIPANITSLSLTYTALEESPASLRHCYRLSDVGISSSKNFKTFSAHLPPSVTYLELCDSGIKTITDCIKGLRNLRHLYLSRCKRLTSLPELPYSLQQLLADDCISLERVSDPLNTPDAELHFTNCIKLSQQARRAIIKGSFVRGWALLPGREVPTEFDYCARGNSLTILRSAFNRFKVCVVMSLNHPYQGCLESKLLCRCKVIGNSVKSTDMTFLSESNFLFKTRHLLIFHISLPFIDTSEVSRKIVFKFSSIEKDFNIVECGVQILTDVTDLMNNGHWVTHESDEASDIEEEEDDDCRANKTSESGSDDDSISDGRYGSESDKASDKEEDGRLGTSESESDEASDKEEGYKSESGEVSEDEDEDEDSANDSDYESVSRKRMRTTTMITNLKWGIKKRRG